MYSSENLPFLNRRFFCLDIVEKIVLKSFIAAISKGQAHQYREQIAVLFDLLHRNTANFMPFPLHFSLKKLYNSHNSFSTYCNRYETGKKFDEHIVKRKAFTEDFMNFLSCVELFVRRCFCARNYYTHRLPVFQFIFTIFILFL